MQTVYTMGANGTRPTVMLSILIKYGITHLFDIRTQPNHPFVRCRGADLKFICERGGIEYLEVRQLAPTPKLLKEIKRGKADINRYFQEIGREGLQKAAELINATPVPCFLSAEKLPNSNPRYLKDYRKDLVERLADMAGESTFQITHVEGRKYFKDALLPLALFRGKTYNLLDIFKKVNAEYFKGRYREEDVVLIWEKVPKRFNLMAYFFYPNFIAFNTVMDQEAIPPAILEFLMRHELEHLHRAHTGRPMGHTADFYTNEADFKQFAENLKFDQEFSKIWNAFYGGKQS